MNINYTINSKEVSKPQNKKILSNYMNNNNNLRKNDFGNLSNSIGPL
jgi:hypothetical protein